LSWTKRLTPFITIIAITVVMLPASAHAQRGHGGRGRTVVITPYYNTFWAPYYNPFFGWNAWAWGYPGPYPMYGPPFNGDAGARIQVTPRETEVYVDGYRAGIVDDFDGFAQRLRVPPGEHTIELYLDGYRLVTQNILFQPGDTYKLRHTMEPLPAGEARPARPAPKAGTTQTGVIYDAFGRPSSNVNAAPAAGAGVLAIRVQPPDATVLVDGETWQGSGSERLELQVTAGAHRIEVRKDGYLPFSTTVQATAGQTTPVNVSLTKGGE
jgi:hypothetical protein